MAKILLIEDDFFIQRLVVEKLKDKNHQVLVATNGREGISLAHAEYPDLILMDLRLPELDGWAATEQLKNSPDTKGIPILALTAQSLTSVVEKFNGVTCDGYIQKPINFNRLYGQIDSFTDGRAPKKITA